MKHIFNENQLQEMANKHKKTYQSATPFPHIYIDNFMDSAILEEALNAFPKEKEFEFYKYENPLEKKLAFDQISKLPDPIADILIAMNTAPFLQFLEVLTGIEGLIPDPYYRGGGIHQIVKGGKLDVHIDFNKHTKLKLDRRLNVLLYLNKDWKEEYGGHFELWKGYQKNGNHSLESCEQRILPLFNRLAIFSTSEKSYHGHPERLTCPDGWTRKSIATYFYSNGRPAEEDVDAHSTTFIKRPEDDDSEELNKLREARNKGRLNTNIKNTIS
ncbi:proline hydroxylase [Candidatus Marinamargulisbacteria bacterium SCGC AG-414-C22]|nr:proline hydroxylase [Candidatus Marinamargulisbacteria bacterium SCGC AG-414-C22]